ncbi:DUF5825 family protein [Bacillus toyonensis]|uniref:DUF5825 family protein n=1 Tax=Bacillus toyonensis TaxID=155322 RepID=UPI000BEDD8DD|nr:DUF5825 family protein [Bacillus toyonensis]PED90006.1 hypothetical protein CON90_28675 [Bacillus toyonensis]
MHSKKTALELFFSEDAPGLDISGYTDLTTLSSNKNNDHILNSEHNLFRQSVYTDMISTYIQELNSKSTASPLSLSKETPRKLVHELFILRELTEQYINLNWKLITNDLETLDPFIHLIPPSVGYEGCNSVENWRESYFKEALTYRRGPGFVKVRDERSPDETELLLIDDIDELNVFHLTMLPTKISTLGNLQNVLQILVDFNLVFVIEDWAINLCTRANRNKVPYQ